MGWHFEVQPAGIARVPGFFSNNWFSTSLVRWAANAAYVKRAFSNSNFWHSARICLIQIASTQTFIKSSSIHAFSWVFTMNPARMLVADSSISFSLENNHWWKHFLIPRSWQNNCKIFLSPPEVQTTHSLVPLSAIHFDGTLSKKGRSFIHVSYEWEGILFDPHELCWIRIKLG